MRSRCRGQDRARLEARGLDLPLWHEDGRLRTLGVMDAAMLKLYRQDWRTDMGLPDDGVAEHVP